MKSTRGPLNDDPEMLISIVIPAYNEEKRIGRYLRRLCAYCASSGMTSEIIVADDGSSDNTAGLAAAFEGVHVIRLKSNGGKGCAVAEGFRASTGEICIFLDADGSVAPEEIGRNLHYIKEDGYDVFAGSRVLTGGGCRLKARWYRRAMGAVFNLFLHAMLPVRVLDTQCGFKMFRRETVGPLFCAGCLPGYGFDMEIIYRAQLLGYRIKEGPVSWEHTGGSKVNLFRDPFLLLLDILKLKRKYAGGLPAGDKSNCQKR